MNALDELRAKVAKRARAATGTVIAIEGETTRVRTAGGVVFARSRDGVSVGDEVLVSGGAIAGRVPPVSSLPVYPV